MARLNLIENFAVHDEFKTASRPELSAVIHLRKRIDMKSVNLNQFISLTTILSIHTHNPFCIGGEMEYYKRWIYIFLTLIYNNNEFVIHITYSENSKSNSYKINIFYISKSKSVPLPCALKSTVAEWKYLIQ